MTKILLLASILLWGSSLVTCERFWDGLRVSFNMDPNSKRGFYKLPRTLTELRDSDMEYKQLNSRCEGAKSLGYRFVIHGIDQDDLTLILLFDARGYIAGVQNAVSRKVADAVRTKHFKYHFSKYYVLDKVGNEDYYFLTVYFIDPSRICTGRTRKQFEEEGTGTGLYLQTGNNPYCNYNHPPRNQCGMLGTRWNRGGCINLQGIYYLYEVCEEYDCRDWFPYTVIFNEGQLVEFHFQNFGKLENPLYGASTMDQLNHLIPPPFPKCLREDLEYSGGLSFLHFYLINEFRDIKCPKGQNL